MGQADAALAPVTATRMAALVMWEAGAGAIDGCYPCLPAKSAEDGLCRSSGFF